MNIKRLIFWVLIGLAGSLIGAVAAKYDVAFWGFLACAAAVAAIAPIAVYVDERWLDSPFDTIYRTSRVRQARSRAKGTRKMRGAPGTWWLQLVDFFFSPKTVEQTFKPIVADWRTEYTEALHQKRFLKARWINVRYTYHFIMAMGLSKLFSIIKSVKSVIK